jgi:branched-chain amino acid aminotransferase
MAAKKQSKEPVVWCNGMLAPASRPCISALDFGFTVGCGVFETLLAPDGRPFAFTRHYERLARSAEPFELALPGADELREACAEVLLANGLLKTRARLRITVTPGVGPPGMVPGDGPPTVTVVAVPCPKWTKPAKVALSRWMTPGGCATTGLKTTSYADKVLCLAEARKAGCDEALLINPLGHLCEGTGSNVWLVEYGALHTPSLDGGCLDGITRALVLEICDDLGVKLDFSPRPAGALLACDEAFLTSSTREVQPVASVDGHPVPDVPGPVTARISEAFDELLRGRQDP